MSALLAELGFPADAFAVAMGRRPAARDDPAVEVDGDAVAFDASGIDTVVFTFRPNPGEPARPLARIASGGELSRVALAVKQVLADVDDTPTLVFDEIDTGIGGRSADPVGRSLWTLARAHQVLCVTHLPQIAAYADAHYRIAKRERDGRTVTEITRARPGGPGGGAGADDRRAGRRRGGRAVRPRAPRPGGGVARRPGRRGRGLTPPPCRRRPTSTRRSRGTSRTCAWSAGSRTRRSRAYRADLTDFAMSRGARRGAGRTGRRWPSAISRPGPGAAARATRDSPRRASAGGRPSIRGFYRFAYGDGLIAVDVAAHLDLPRQPRLLPETLTVDEVERLLEAAAARRPPRGGHAGPPRPKGWRCATAPCWSSLYAAGLRVSEALGLDREHLARDGGWVRVIGKGDKERAVPVGEVALAWLDRYLAWPRAAWLAAAGEGDGPGTPLFVTARGRRLGRQAAWSAVKDAAAAAGLRRPRVAPYPAPLLRDAPAGGRGRPAGRPGAARTCQYCHHAALHARHRRTHPRGLCPRPSAGLRNRGRTMTYVDSLLASGERVIRVAHQHWFVLVWRARWAVLGLVVGLVFLILKVLNSRRERAPCGTILGWLTLILLAIGLISLAWGWLKFQNEEYVITSRRIIHAEGVVNKLATDSSLEKINDAILVETALRPDLRLRQPRGADRVGGRHRAPGHAPRREGLQEGDARGQARAGDRADPAHDAADARSRGGPRGRGRRPRRPSRRRPRPAIDTADEVADALGRLGELRDKGVITRRGVRGQEGGAARAALSAGAG